MKTRPIRFSTATSSPSDVRMIAEPLPGTPAGKLAGRTSRGSSGR